MWSKRLGEWGGGGSGELAAGERGDHRSGREEGRDGELGVGTGERRSHRSVERERPERGGSGEWVGGGVSDGVVREWRSHRLVGSHIYESVTQIKHPALNSPESAYPVGRVARSGQRVGSGGAGVTVGERGMREWHAQQWRSHMQMQSHRLKQRMQGCGRPQPFRSRLQLFLSPPTLCQICPLLNLWLKSSPCCLPSSIRRTGV